MSYIARVILAKLSNRLKKLGYPRDASEIEKMMLKLNEDDEDDADVSDIAAKSIGLQENNIHQYLGGGVAVEPIYFDTGDLTSR